MIEVSFHLAGYGPVSIQFDEVTHPLFVRLPSGYYLRFEDAIEDSRLLTALQRRIRRRLDDRLTQDGVAMSVQKGAQEMAAYSWLLTQLERSLEKRHAVREAESVMGLAATTSPKPTLLNDDELKAVLADAGQTGIRHEDGFGLVRMTIDEAREALPLD